MRVYPSLEGAVVLLNGAKEKYHVSRGICVTLWWDSCQSCERYSGTKMEFFSYLGVYEKTGLKKRSSKSDTDLYGETETQSG